jgi:hypothetical protein
MTTPLTLDQIARLQELAEQDGDFQLVNRLELLECQQREQATHDKWQDRFDNDTSDLY